MPYGNSNAKSVRLTGLFKAKRPGLLVGSCKPEDMPKLIEKIKAAMAAKKGLTFFVWSNQGPGPAASLSVDVAQDAPQRSASGGGVYGNRPKRDQRSIDDDPFSGDNQDDNNPF